jgi:hypothetical protein
MMRPLLYHGSLLIAGLLRAAWLQLLLVALAMFIAITAAATSNADAASAALADRQQFPAADWWRYYYLDTERLADDSSWQTNAALAFVIPSMAPQQPVLEHCLPAKVSETLYRIDLANLGWDVNAWRTLIAANPYHHLDNALVIRADWLLLQLTDAHENAAYYQLVFGGKAPKTRDEALKILGVNGDAKLQFGLIEGQSGVSVSKVRLVRNLSAARGYAWGTADVLELDPDQDPLEQPEGDFRHDGEEWIVGCRKLHLATGTTGALQVYFLANGKGEIVDRAPVDLVVDHTKFRGLQEIRNAGSCIQCHEAGLNRFTRNELRETLTSGVEAWAYYDDQQKLEQFHLADLRKELDRNNEDFAAIMRLAVGCEPYEAIMSYQSAIHAYDQPLDLNAAARELDAQPAELKLALGLASHYGYRLGARLSSLAHGGTVPRRAWEANYLAVQSLWQQWEAAQ